MAQMAAEAKKTKKVQVKLPDYCHILRFGLHINSLYNKKRNLNGGRGQAQLGHIIQNPSTFRVPLAAMYNIVGPSYANNANSKAWVANAKSEECSVMAYAFDQKVQTHTEALIAKEMSKLPCITKANNKGNILLIAGIKAPCDGCAAAKGNKHALIKLCKTNKFKTCIILYRHIYNYQGKDNDNFKHALVGNGKYDAQQQCVKVQGSDWKKAAGATGYFNELSFDGYDDYNNYDYMVIEPNYNYDKYINDNNLEITSLLLTALCVLLFIVIAFVGGLICGAVCGHRLRKRKLVLDPPNTV